MTTVFRNRLSKHTAYDKRADIIKYMHEHLFFASKKVRPISMADETEPENLPIDIFDLSKQPSIFSQRLVRKILNVEFVWKMYRNIKTKQVQPSSLSEYQKLKVTKFTSMAMPEFIERISIGFNSCCVAGAYCCLNLTGGTMKEIQ